MSLIGQIDMRPVLSTLLCLILSSAPVGAERAVNPFSVEGAAVLRDFADAFCGKFDAEGFKRTQEQTAAFGTLHRGLARLGLKLEAQTLTESYSNLPRDQLAGRFRDISECRAMIWSDWTEIFARSGPASAKVYSDRTAVLCGPDQIISVIVFKDGPMKARDMAKLSGYGIPPDRRALRVGEALVTETGCKITLARTGFDHAFFAMLTFEGG
jgi:hypothetical protein